MPVPIWVALAAAKAAGVGAYYLHRKYVSAKNAKSDDQGDDANNDKDR